MDDNCSSAIETIPALLLKKRKYINVTENTEKKTRNAVQNTNKVPIIGYIVYFRIKIGIFIKLLTKIVVPYHYHHYYYYCYYFILKRDILVYHCIHFQLT